jgi:hypothetical protein
VEIVSSWRGQHGDGGEAQHTQQGLIHTATLSYRVCSLCSSVPRRIAFEPQGRTTSVLRHTTLNAACSWTAPNTTVSQSWSSIRSSQSHRSSFQSPHSLLLDRTQRRGWPHAAVKQDSRKVTHTSLVTMRPPASSCQLCRRIEALHHAAQPLSTRAGSHRSRIG